MMFEGNIIFVIAAFTMCLAAISEAADIQKPCTNCSMPVRWSVLSSTCPNSSSICNADQLCTSDSSNCIPKNVAQCDKYLDLEAGANCGSAGYLLGYGFKYCSKFYNHYYKFDAAGQKYIDCTAKCLLNAMNYLDGQDQGQYPCDVIKQKAYAAHPDCYVECGFCETILKNAAAYNGVIEYKDLAISQIVTTARKCMVELGGSAAKSINQKWKQFFN